MNDKLKPCPFCGGKAEMMSLKNYTTRFFATCLVCGVEMPRIARTRKQAVDVWNRRVDNALEKQIPKKLVIKTQNPIGSYNYNFSNQYYCPVCNALIIIEDKNGFYAGRKQKHCDRCGQALDWSDTNG